MMGWFSFIYFAILCCLGMVGMLILERVSFDGLVSHVGMVGYCAPHPHAHDARHGLMQAQA